MKNIERDLKAFDETICIAVDKITEDKIRKSVEEKGLASRVALTSASAFIV
jgi:hypothetical protein